MAKLTANARKGIISSQFALPAERKFPLIDRAHQINAKARASQMLKAGKISVSTKAKIDNAANKKLAK